MKREMKKELIEIMGSLQEKLLKGGMTKEEEFFVIHGISEIAKKLSKDKNLDAHVENEATSEENSLMEHRHKVTAELAELETVRGRLRMLSHDPISFKQHESDCPMDHDNFILLKYLFDADGIQLNCGFCFKKF